MRYEERVGINLCVNVSPGTEITCSFIFTLLVWVKVEREKKTDEKSDASLSTGCDSNERYLLHLDARDNISEPLVKEPQKQRQEMRARVDLGEDGTGDREVHRKNDLRAVARASRASDMDVQQR